LFQFFKGYAKNGVKMDGHSTWKADKNVVITKIISHVPSDP
jgi:hypothetical protein